MISTSASYGETKEISPLIEITGYVLLIEQRGEKPLAEWYVCRNNQIVLRDSVGRFISKKKALETLINQT